MSETSTTWWDRLFTRRAPEPEETPFSVEESIPNGVRLAGGWSWRLLVIGAVIAVAIFLIIQLRLIIIPLLIAVLVGALLVPLVGFLQRHHWPKWLAVVVTLVGTLAIVAGLLTLVVWQISRGWGDLSGKAVQSFEDLKAALLASPLQLTETQINDYIASALQSIQSDSAVFITGALSVGATLGHVGAGLLLTIFSLIFILIDGKGIWAWVVRIFPKRARAAVDGAGQAGWNTLGNFARVQILVATIDAIGIGLGAFLLGVPLAIPIAVTVFLGSFIPIVGAVVTGALACVIALIYNGWFIALMLLLVVLGVQQLEGTRPSTARDGHGGEGAPARGRAGGCGGIAARRHSGRALRCAGRRRAQRHGALHRRRELEVRAAAFAASADVRDLADRSADPPRLPDGHAAACMMPAIRWRT